MGELELGVGQINSMDSDELTQVRDRILEYMRKVYTDKNLDMVLFMLTDIYNERTELLYDGTGIDEMGCGNGEIDARGHMTNDKTRKSRVV
jgi:manganese-dependent inorganic pyrophosphatase